MSMMGGGSAEESVRDVMLEGPADKDGVRGVFDKGIPMSRKKKSQLRIQIPTKAGSQFHSGSSESGGQVVSMPSTPIAVKSADTHVKKATCNKEYLIPPGNDIRKDDDPMKLNQEAAMPASPRKSDALGTINNFLQNLEDASSSAPQLQTPPNPPTVDTPVTTLETPTISENSPVPRGPFHTAPSKGTSSARYPTDQLPGATWPRGRSKRDTEKISSNRSRGVPRNGSVYASGDARFGFGSIFRNDQILVWRSNTFYSSIRAFDDWFRDKILIPFIWIIIAYNIYLVFSWGWRARYGQYEAGAARMKPQLNTAEVKHSGRLIEKETMLEMYEWPYISKYDREREKEREWEDMANLLDALAREREWGRARK